MSISKRGGVPKWIKRGKGKVPEGGGSNNPMNFKKANARKPRPDTGKKISMFPNQTKK
ncbi:hypothetical protein LCGC14_2593630 [marine sediment metagenome]|uniref:Uncharacterized protein n=1 Tax=marine sediment metagenome TaxID=412755 RepID=A0A0F9D3H7_9ZZZZ